MNDRRMDAGPGAGAAGGKEGAEGVRASVVRELTESIEREGLTRLRAGSDGGGGAGRMVRAADLEGVREVVELARRLMFPGYFEAHAPDDAGLGAHVGRMVAQISEILRDEVRAVVRYRGSGHRLGGAASGTGAPHSGNGAEREDEEAFVERVVGEFVGGLARVRSMLALDVQAAYDGDPAAEHVDEVVLCYPGLDAIFTHRLAHELYRLGVPILPRAMAEQAHSRTGIDIHPGAQIGERFFIDHGSATVIGETSVIGKQVKIYQGVTLGARSFPKDERGRAIKGLKRHPTIGDRVTIYAGAVILGGDTVIGDDCVIAGGVFVTSSVAPGHVVQQTRPEPVLKPHGVPHGPTGARPATKLKESAGGRVDLGWLEEGAGI